MIRQFVPANGRLEAVLIVVTDRVKGAMRAGNLQAMFWGVFEFL
jgi:hypothetical protein